MTKFINLELLSIASPISPCDLNSSFLVKFVVHMAMLPALTITVLIAVCVAKLCVRKPKVLENGTMTRSLDNGDIRNRAARIMSVIVFLLYPGIGTRIFRVGKCHTVAEKSWLVADFSVQCWQGPHMYAALGALICTVGFVIGIPMATYLLLRSRRDRLADPEVLATFGTLYGAYTPSCWYFECVEMLRKMILAGGLVLVAPGSSTQILIGIIVALGFLTLLQYLNPYEDPNDGKLQLLASGQIVLTLLAAFALKTDANGEYEIMIMGILLVVLNTCVLVVGATVSLMMLPACYGNEKVGQATLKTQIGWLKKSIPAFAHLRKNDITVIIRAMTFRKVRNGRDLFLPNDCKDTLFVILKGNISLIDVNGNSKQTERRIFGAVAMDLTRVPPPKHGMIGKANTSNSKGKWLEVLCLGRNEYMKVLQENEIETISVDDLDDGSHLSPGQKVLQKNMQNKMQNNLKMIMNRLNNMESSSMASITNGNSNIDNNVSIHQKEIDRLHEEHHEHDRRLRKKHEMLRKKTTTRVQERLRARTALRQNKTLQKTELFKDLSTDAISKIIAVMEFRSFATASDLVTQGDTASEFMVIMKGAATVFKDGTKIRTFGCLDFIGEGALIEGDHVRGATVTATVATQVLVLTYERYQELLLDGTIEQKTHEMAARRSKSYLLEDAKRADNFSFD